MFAQSQSTYVLWTRCCGWPQVKWLTIIWLLPHVWFVSLMSFWFLIASFRLLCIVFVTKKRFGSTIYLGSYVMVC